MSWFTRAFTTLTNDPNEYYTTVTPVEFYEWRFLRAIPKGTRLSKHLPRSDAFIENQLIVSAKIENNSFSSNGPSLELTEDTPASVYLKIGSLQSPFEIIEKFSSLKNEFSKSLSEFKRGITTQKYFTSLKEDPHLYRVESSSEEDVTLQSFGTVGKVREKLAQVFALLKNSSNKKQWRAYELEKFKKFENYLLAIGNPNFQIDATKMEYLVTIAQLKPELIRTIPWKDCFLEVSSIAIDLQKKLNMFDSMNWVKYILKSNTA